MNEYEFQLKISTLAICMPSRGGLEDSFELDGIRFSHWEGSPLFGNKSSHAWLARGSENASNIKEADKQFTKKLNNIVPKIAMITQCYTEHIGQPFLVYKRNSNCAFFKYVKERSGVPLFFNQKSLKALKILLERKIISERFFYYWNDMVNSTGYPAKLILICSALEVLAKDVLDIKDRRTFNKNQRIEAKSKVDDFLKESILGEELFEKVLGRNDKGIRHRLIHGDYFSPDQDKENYLDQIYRKIIEYFNVQIFQEALIHENVVNPQRHPFDNREQWNGFIERKKGTNEQFNLKELLEESHKEGIGNFKFFECISPIENY